jgi:tetratricopeptide (TPR) repeat protein
MLAKGAAQRALALEPSAEAHVAMGVVLALADFNWRDSEREFRRALDLKPSYTIGRGWYATTCLYPLRRYAEAINQLQECLTADPLSVPMRVMLGQTLILAADFDAAVREVRHALALDPDFMFGYVTLACRSWELGRTVQLGRRYSRSKPRLAIFQTSGGTWGSRTQSSDSGRRRNRRCGNCTNGLPPGSRTSTQPPFTMRWAIRPAPSTAWIARGATAASTRCSSLTTRDW